MFLATSAQTTFDANGNASLTFSPNKYGIKWTISRIVVSTTSTAGTLAYVYRGAISQANLIDSTYNGNQDMTDTPVELTDSDFITVSFTGGDIGSIAFVRIEGEQEARF